MKIKEIIKNIHDKANSKGVTLQFLFYAFIGGICAVANILAFLVIAKFSKNLLVNVWLAYFISSALNYLLCILFLFKHKARWSSAGEIIAYILTLIIMGLVDYYSTWLFLSFGMNNFWAKSCSNLVGLVGNFLLRKFFVFPEKKQK